MQTAEKTELEFTDGESAALQILWISQYHDKNPVKRWQFNRLMKNRGYNDVDERQGITATLQDKGMITIRRERQIRKKGTKPVVFELTETGYDYMLNH